jgi:hypothetical protein
MTEDQLERVILFWPILISGQLRLPEAANQFKEHS